MLKGILAEQPVISANIQNKGWCPDVPSSFLQFIRISKCMALFNQHIQPGGSVCIMKALKMRCSGPVHH